MSPIIWLFHQIDSVILPDERLQCRNFSWAVFQGRKGAGIHKEQGFIRSRQEICGLMLRITISGTKKDGPVISGSIGIFFQLLEYIYMKPLSRYEAKFQQGRVSLNGIQRQGNCRKVWPISLFKIGLRNEK